MSTPLRKQFYNSKAWKDCREGYLASVGHLCEECLKKGKITPAYIVHHKIYLNDRNVLDPDVSLNFKNLEAVCLDCHNEIHEGTEHRYKVDELGRVQAL